MNIINDAMLFVKVVQAGSLTKASLQLDYSKSQISKRINGLEQHLGVSLFIRTSRGITLTEEGQHFYDDCLSISASFDKAKEGLIAKHNHLKGHIAITAPMTIGSLYIGPLIAKFLALHTNITISLDLSDHARSLIDDNFDLAIRASTKLPDSSLRAKSLYQYDFVIAGSPEYFERMGTPLVPKDLSNHRVITCLTVGYQAIDVKWPFVVDGVHEDVSIHRVASVTHMWVQKQFALEGVGLIRVPRYWLSDTLENQTLVPVLQSYMPHQSHLYAVYKNTQTMPHRLRALIDYLALHLPNALE